MTESKVGLDCFLSMERPCNAACMAYLDDSSVPQEADYAIDGYPRQWARCAVLVNLHRLGKHIVHIAASHHQGVQLQKQEAADRAHRPPPING